MSLAEDVLARARAMLQGVDPVRPPTFLVLPKDAPAPEPRHRYRTGMSREAEKFVVRMPDDMRERMAKFASLHHRSSNSECIMAMEWWMDRQGLMWALLKATERELSQLEHLRKGEEQEALDLIAQRQPETAALIQQLKAMIPPG